MEFKYDQDMGETLILCTKKGGYSCETIKSFTAHLAKAPQVDANLLLYNTLLFKYLIV